MVRAVHLGLLLEEILLDAGEDGVRRIEVGATVLLVEIAPAVHLRGADAGENLLKVCGNMACEGWKHGRHVQLALPLEDLLLQLCLSVNPALRQRPLPAVDVYHALPRQMGRPGEVGAYLLVGHAILAPYFLPDRFLSCDGERHVDAVQSHPVDEAFPLFPFPPRHGVAEGAVVEEESNGHFHLARDLFGNFRHRCWQFHRVEVVPAHVGKAVLLNVTVQADGHGVGIVPADKYFLAFLEQFIGVGGRLYLLEDNGFCLVRHHSACQCFGSLLVGSLEGHQHKRDHQ